MLKRHLSRVKLLWLVWCSLAWRGPRDIRVVVSVKPKFEGDGQFVELLIGLIPDQAIAYVALPDRLLSCRQVGEILDQTAAALWRKVCEVQTGAPLRVIGEIKGAG